MPDQLIVSASGIRGVVGASLQPEVAARYGAAFGTFLRREKEPTRAGGGGGRPGGWILVGRDSRTSGPVLADAVSSGVRASGWDVRHAGVLPTPSALLAVQDDEEARGGVVLTASHNPVEWNGLKLATGDGEFVSVQAGRRVQRIYRAGPGDDGVLYEAWDGLGGRGEHPGAIRHHVDRILGLPLVEPDEIAAAGLTVALDPVRGAGGPVLRLLLERLGCRSVGIHLEPDGRFPRPPEPRPEHLGELGELVRREGADLGLAVDPDADRLALVDESGEPVGEDWTLALAAEYVLQRQPGPLVTNLSSSRVVGDAARRAGQPVHLAPVGEAHVARRMREVNAAVGGEGNGGVMLPDLHLTRDAPLAAALVLGLLASSGSSLSGLVSSRPGYHIAKLRAPRPEGELDRVYRALASGAREGASQDRQDGLRLDWPGERQWVHVRPSGTEPILRIVAEAPDEETARSLAEWALQVVQEAP